MKPGELNFTYPMTGKKEQLHTFPSGRDENIETFRGTMRKHRSRDEWVVWRLGMLYPLHRTAKGRGFIRLGEGRRL